jgi:hypothetical protein
MAGFGFGASFPTLEWLTAGRTNVFRGRTQVAPQVQPPSTT